MSKTFPTMHNIAIVVESLDNVIPFFEDLGLVLEGRSIIEGEWVGRLTGLGDQKVEIAMLATPDTQNRVELAQFFHPNVISDHRNTPINSLGYLRMMFTVENLDLTLKKLEKYGTTIVGEIMQYEQMYRLCYIRGVEGILIGIVEVI